MSKTAIISLIFTALVALLIWKGMTGIGQATCEVCITFDGETLCRTGQGRDRDAAVSKAVDAACAVLTYDRAANMKCSDTKPDRIECR